MSVLQRIAYYQERRDDVPNQELAKDLADTRNIEGLREIACNLWNKNKSIRSDCIKVLYETGYIAPDLIVEFVEEFLKLTNDKDNRMVWGAMIALGCIADRCPDEIWSQIDKVIVSIQNGSVITVVWGVRVLAGVAAAEETYHIRLYPILLEQLKKCIPRDVPTHAESMICAIRNEDIPDFIGVLEERKSEMTLAQLSRLKKVLKKLPAGEL